MLVVTFEAYLKTDEITSPCDVIHLLYDDGGEFE